MNPHSVHDPYIRTKVRFKTKKTIIRPEINKFTSFSVFFLPMNNPLVFAQAVTRSYKKSFLLNRKNIFSTSENTRHGFYSDVQLYDSVPFFLQKDFLFLH